MGEMILPGLYAMMSPLIIGLMIGPRFLAGMLAGAIASGMMLALMMSNAGGAWDNSKKYIEIEGAVGGKGTDTHKACVIGDTVGDPFKDTSGPALNILIKLMSMVSLVIAPLLSPKDWATYEYGFIPLAICVIITVIVYHLYWKNFEAEVDKRMKEFDAMEEKPVDAVLTALSNDEQKVQLLEGDSINA